MQRMWFDYGEALLYKWHQILILKYRQTKITLLFMTNSAIIKSFKIIIKDFKTEKLHKAAPYTLSSL